MTRRLEAGPLLVTLGAVLLLVSLFLHWFTGEITAWCVNTNRAVERENLANTSPVDTAVSSRLTIDSPTTRTFAAVDSGNIAPYPIVPIVCTLKKNASRNESGVAWLTPPTTR